jgi:hypothetical protein
LKLRRRRKRKKDGWEYRGQIAENLREREILKEAKG